MLKACHCLCTMSSEKKKNRKRSQAIDKELKKSEAVARQTIKLVMLGTCESGKSTILKQMRIIHISKFSEQERLEKINDIKSNIRNSVLSILDAMERLQITFDDPTLVEAREDVYDNIDLIFIKPSLHNLTSSNSTLINLVNNNQKNDINNNNEYFNDAITSTVSFANPKLSASNAKIVIEM